MLLKYTSMTYKIIKILTKNVILDYNDVEINKYWS